MYLDKKDGKKIMYNGYTYVKTTEKFRIVIANFGAWKTFLLSSINCTEKVIDVMLFSQIDFSMALQKVA